MKSLFCFLGLIVFPLTLYNQNSITDFGAIGDGKTLNTQAIQTAIDKTVEKGGGTLIIPKGIFLTGTIVLKSNLKLQITEGGILLGSTSRNDYLKNDWYALLLAKGQKNISIVGKGIIDGQGRA
jgi:polygalacturonase